MSIFLVALLLAVADAADCRHYSLSSTDIAPRQCDITCISGDTYNGWECKDYFGANGEPMQSIELATTHCKGKPGKYRQKCDTVPIPICGKTASNPTRCRITCHSGDVYGWDCKSYTGANDKPMKLRTSSERECSPATTKEKECVTTWSAAEIASQRDVKIVRDELCESELCKPSGSKCAVPKDISTFVRKKEESKRIPLEVDYEFYGTKSPKEGGVDRHGDTITCNGHVLFHVMPKSKTVNPTQPWKWIWQLVTDPTETYMHADGLIFKNLATQIYVQLLPPSRIGKKKGCKMQHEISYSGRRWAYENKDLANYNLYLWTMGHTQTVPSLSTRIHRAIFCHGKQAGMWCQLYAQNNALQYKVDDPDSYTAFSKKIMEKEETKGSHRKTGFHMKMLEPGFQRFGLTFEGYSINARPETLAIITQEFMIQRRCIAVLISYTIQILKVQKKKKDIVFNNGAHFITYKYLGDLGWFWLDSNVVDPHGPFETLVDAENDANTKQLLRNDYRKKKLGKLKAIGKSFASVGQLGHGEITYWKTSPDLKSIFLVNKDADFRRRYVDEMLGTSKSAKNEVYDDFMDDRDYENEYENKYENEYENKYENEYEMHESVYWHNALLDFSIISMERIILLTFLCCGLCLFAYIGFTYSCCVGFTAGYLFNIRIKYQLHEKVNINDVGNEEQI